MYITSYFSFILRGLFIWNKVCIYQNNLISIILELFLLWINFKQVHWCYSLHMLHFTGSFIFLHYSYIFSDGCWTHLFYCLKYLLNLDHFIVNYLYSSSNILHLTAVASGYDFLKHYGSQWVEDKNLFSSSYNENK